MPILLKRRNFIAPELARAESTATTEALVDLQRLATFLGESFSQKHIGDSIRGRYAESLQTFVLSLDGLHEMQVGIHMPTWSIHVFVGQRLRLQYTCRERSLADVGHWVQKQDILTKYLGKSSKGQQSSAEAVIGSHRAEATRDATHWILAAQRSLRLASTSTDEPRWHVDTMTLEVPASIEGTSVTLGVAFEPKALPHWYLKQGGEQLGVLRGASLCNRTQSDQRDLITAFVLRGEVTDEFSPSSEETESFRAGDAGHKST